MSVFNPKKPLSKIKNIHLVDYFLKEKVLFVLFVLRGTFSCFCTKRTTKYSCAENFIFINN